VISTERCVIGTWPLSGDFGVVPLTQIHETLQSAKEYGFIEYDTAPNYGLGFMEQCLGNVFPKNINVKINTKVGNIPFFGKSFQPNDLKKSVEDSLTRLKREQVHILYLHNPRTEIENYQELADFMQALKKEGKIQYSGVSLAKNYTYTEEVYELFDYFQDEASLLYLDRFKNPGIIEKTYFRSPLASGLLGENINKNTTFADDDYRSGWLKGERLESILKRVDRIKEEISSYENLNLQTVAKKFLLESNPHCKIIFGTKRKKHIEQLAKDLHLKPLDEKLKINIMNLYDQDFGLQNEQHLRY